MAGDSDEWGPWIEHRGGYCPVSEGVEIIVERRCGLIEQGVSSGVDKPSWTWPFGFHPLEVIRYRIRRPKALREMIERIETLPAPEREREDA